MAEAARVVERRLLAQAVDDVDQGDGGPTPPAVPDALRCRVIGFSEQAGPWFAQAEEWPELVAEVQRLGTAVADLIERAIAGDDEAAA